MIFETHAHYDREDYDYDRDRLLTTFPAKGVAKVVNISATIDSVSNGLDLCARYPFMYMTVGIHPEDIENLDERTFDSLRYIASTHRYSTQSADRQPCSVAQVRCVVGVGEIGLDYHYLKEAKDEAAAEANKSKQIYWFKKQLEWTVDGHYPVVLHSREAKDDTLNIVKAAYPVEPEAGNAPYGVLHCYSYDVDYACEFARMGFMIGVGGIVTFKKNGALSDVVDALPLEHIVVETDAPYLSPMPFRGERNTSLNLPYIIEKIAQIKGISPQKVEDATYENAMRLYRI